MARRLREEAGRLAIPKFVGIETEYGIAVDGPEKVNPVVASSLVVSSYRQAGERDFGWDNSDEHPLRDARGTDLDELHYELSSGSELDVDLGLANTVLTNGARFYVDHAHPEYATPECSNARDVVIWDKAGEVILDRAAKRASQMLPAGGRVLIHKNNTDGKGAAYGTHENYLVPRHLPFSTLTDELMGFFVSRLLFVGAGRIGSEFDDGVEFQLSQRADFFEVEVGLETTMKRPLMNTRDEPHADATKYRRLHVINGDANLCEVATFLKAGTMLVMLDAIDDGFPLPNLQPAEPVPAFHAVSRDIDLDRPVKLADGDTRTALEMQWAYFEACSRYVGQRGARDEVVEAVMIHWQDVLSRAERGREHLVGHVDWATKLELVDAYAQRHQLGLTSPQVRMVDLQYHDVRADKGLYNRMLARGRIHRLVSDAEIAAATEVPPADTRAWFRGECIRRFRRDVVAVGWDAIIVDTGADTLQRIPMMEPGRGTRALVGDLFERETTAADLVDALRADGPS